MLRALTTLERPERRGAHSISVEPMRLPKARALAPISRPIEPAEVRASRFFALSRLAEAMEKRLMLEIVTTFPHRDAAFQPFALTHFALAAGFHRGLRLPPHYFAGIVALSAA